MLKKWKLSVAFLLALSIILSGCGTTTESGTESSAQDESENYVELEIKYRVFSDGTAEVTGYSGSGNHATIDSEYEDCEVVRIADSAFEGCDTLEKVLFWADIEEIGDSAFKDCTALSEIGIPIETATIGDHAFEGCSALSELIIWGDSEIGAYSFAGCVSLTKASIPNETVNVGEHAFEGCTALSEVVFWGGRYIGAYSFADCISLEKVSFPQEIEYVGEHAFDGCTNLASITVWGDDTLFGYAAFDNCPNLTDKPDSSRFLAEGEVFIKQTDDEQESIEEDDKTVETEDTEEIEIAEETEVKEETKASEETKTVNKSNKTKESDEIEVIEYVWDDDTNEFIAAYNHEYPDEKITEDQIEEIPYMGATIKINDHITYEVGESDGSTTYDCYSNMEFNQANRSEFLKYVDRMVDLSIYDISYEFSDNFPTYEAYGEYERNAIHIIYQAREEGTEKHPTFEVSLYKQTW